MKKRILYVSVASAILCIIGTNLEYSKLNDLTGINNSGIHFNLLTVSSIVAGFMFTNLGVLISVSDHDFIKKLRTTTIIENKNERIIKGIIFNILSMFISLIFILELEKIFFLADRVLNAINIDFIISSYLINYLAIFGITSLIMGFLYFAKSVKDINVVLKAIQKNNKKEKLSDEVIKELKNNISESKKAK